MKSLNHIATAFVLALMLGSMSACIDRAAKISSFTGPQTSIIAGQSAQICYELVKAVSARIDPVGPLSDTNKNCVNVEPQQTTTYTLYATGVDGRTVDNTLTLEVTPPPPVASIVTFEAKQKEAAAPGTPAELCYEVTRARSLEIKPEVGNVEPADKGCRTVKPTRTTTYELVATGTDNQTVTKDVTVKVVQPPARIVRFDLTPENIKAGGKVTICYQVADASAAFVQHLKYTLKLGPSECVDVQPTRSTVFTLEARNLDGQLVSKQARVTVEQPPVEIDFSAESTTVEKGNATVLHYKISNAEKRQISAGGTPKVLNDDTGQIQITPSRTTTYTLTAQDPDGKAISRTVTVNVVAPAQARILKFEPAVQTIGLGQEAQLCYGVTMEAKVRITSESQNIARDFDSSEDRCIGVRPRSSDTFTLTATGPNGNPVTRQVRVNVTIPPPFIQFGARSRTQSINTRIVIAPGEPAQLCYRLANVTEARINPGNIRIGGSNCLNLNPLASTITYTLSATGIDGTTRNAQVRIDVVNPPPRR